MRRLGWVLALLLGWTGGSQPRSLKTCASARLTAGDSNQYVGTRRTGKMPRIS